MRFLAVTDRFVESLQQVSLFAIEVDRSFNQDAAQQIAPFVTTVHAQNYVVVGKNTRSLVSDGLVDFNTVIGIFRAVGFDGYLEVEFVKEDDPGAALKADAAYLRKLCDTL